MEQEISYVSVPDDLVITEEVILDSSAADPKDENSEDISESKMSESECSQELPPTATTTADEVMVIEELSDSDSGVGSVVSNVSTATKATLSRPSGGTVSGSTSAVTSDSENSKDGIGGGSGNSGNRDVVLMRSGVNGGNLTTLLKGSPSDTSIPAISAVDDKGKVKMTFDDGDIKKMDEDKLTQFIKTLSREHLDQIVKEKIMKCWSLHSSVGQLHRKLLETDMQKDRLVQNVLNLERQVTEMMKAVRSMAENSGRHTNGVVRHNKDQQPLRFYRSVGIQVVVDSALVKHPSTGFPSGKIVTPKHAAVSSTNVLKSGNATNINVVRGIATSTGNRPGGGHHHINGNANATNHAQKRVMSYQSSATSQSMANNMMITTDSHGNKVRIIGETQATRLVRPMTTSIPSVQRPITATSTTPAGMQRAGAPKGAGGIMIDLTSDDESPRGSPQNVIMTSSGANLRLPQNQVLLSGNNMNMPLRFVNAQNQPIQILSGAQVQLINGTPTSRPLMFSPGSGTTITSLSASGRPLLQSGNGMMQRAALPPQMRAIAPRAPTVTAVRLGGNSQATTTVIRASPQGIRLGGTAIPPGVTINRAQVATISRVQQAEKKFNLPALPVPDTTPRTTRGLKDMPPQPELTLKEQNGGIVLSWTHKTSDNFAEISTYQLFACQEPLHGPLLKAPAWKKVGDVKSLPLPMACTLSQFSDDNRYHFIVRGIDVYNRTGPFCQPSAISLTKKK